MASAAAALDGAGPLRRVVWWWWFLLDVLACVLTSAIAGALFAAYALNEDVRFAWRRGTHDWHRL